ncbi:MAG: phosphoribosylamine--glycine ligase [Jaaginema sp. PMC 1079.18]|nr:phosphoribosylamine--glycine ligase [Jaaginema sp. PMC 1080.18]MEC4852410.1 phosphoribosylamine--glycine ligase [Jaaginema sp. PMC 1079.18]MEC4865662.1 phosphoribosylamine--glycine ligase [Jaaginema sp. PMC 1078.18]
MKILVVGNGGREQAIAWALLRSPQVKQIICIPGNGGTAQLERCHNMPMRVDDFEGITRFALVQGVSFVVVGPELPLAKGISDYLRQQNIKVFGPSQAGAQIEASKTWAKDLMAEAGIPTGVSQSFTDPEAAQTYVNQQGAPIVVKADGLAAGKGVVVATTVTEAQNAIADLWEQGFRKLVIEEFLTGQEVSVLAITDGKTVRPLLPAQDHKQIGEGDTGPNTGGMGVYAPTPLVSPQLLQTIQDTILKPTIATLNARGIDYCGVLYAGLTIDANQTCRVLEFNCRFGDPETQAILPLLKTPLEEILLACIEQRLDQLPPLEWHPGSAVCIVAASQGYPGAYTKGFPIQGIAEAEATGAIVFHAGTKYKQPQTLTDGGRVLGVTAVGEDFNDAIAKAYTAIDCIEFDGIYYRRDIGHRLNR